MKLPVIALIGQKNVGKSTLFNRLTRTNDALIANYSGLTRDRQYGYICCKLFKSIIIDTGGIDELYFSNSIKVKNGVYYQTELAIKESDIILFVVDGRDSETSVDHSIISFLRKLNKSIFVIINKIDDIKNNKYSMFWECYNFGIENIIISAMHGYGISNLLKKLSFYISRKIVDNNTNCMLIMNQDIFSKKCRLKKFFPISSSIKNNFIILAVVGCPNVGKSTFVNKILGKERIITCDIPGTTRDSIYTYTIYNEQCYILIDTAGVRRKKKIYNNIVEKISISKTFQVVKDAHIILFMVDANIGISDQDLFTLKCVMNIGMSLIIIVNKWDEIPVRMHYAVKEILYKKISFIEFFKIHFISALHEHGIKNVFESIQIIFNKLINVRSINTSKLTRIMRVAIAKFPPPLLRGNVKIQPKYVHIGGYNPLILIIHGSHVSKLPSNYQRYLKNFFYKNLNIEGVILHIRLKDSFNTFYSKKLFS